MAWVVEHGVTPRFGIQFAPVASELDDIREWARSADADGLDLLGIQDHPYVADHVDAFSLIGTVLAETERLRVFPDVANLPLRGPALLGKQAASLDLASGGRFELGLGAGGFQSAITAMGGPHRAGAEALDALEESIALIRALWRPGETVRFSGEHYSINGVHAGPAPAHEVGIWLGSVGPKALTLTGRIADGWAAPIPHYLPYESWLEAQDTIDAAAVEAGREPTEVVRIAQLVGDITETAASDLALRGEQPIRTTASDWARVLARLAKESRFDTFVYWPEQPGEEQLRRWTKEVVPAARDLIG